MEDKEKQGFGDQCCWSLEKVASRFRINHKSRFFVAGVAVLCLVAATVTVLLWRQALLPDRFARVEKGVLYRSGQPNGPMLKRLFRDYGIKTVVNLRGVQETALDPEANGYADVAKNGNLKMIYLPLTTNHAECAKEFLAIMADKTHWPVLVHCAGGKERTGMMVAVYRLSVDGWSFDRTFKEMKSFGYPVSDKNQDRTQFVREYAGRVNRDRPRLQN